ncbi:MAG: extracellular solute-binding protein [Fimbriimonas sp.]
MGAKGSLGLLLAVAVILGILRMDGGAVGPVGKKKVEIRFWNGFTGPDGRTMLEIIREFSEKNPDVLVTMQRMDWATYYNKLMVAATDGRGPELFVLPSGTLTRMHRAGFIDSANSVYAAGIDTKDFDPYVLQQVTIGKDFVGVPLDIHPQGLYSNRAMLKEAGLDHPPRNREEFIRAARGMKRDLDGDGNPDEWGFALTMWRNNFMTLIPQFGGRYVDENGRADLNCPGNQEALEFLREISLGRKLMPPPENAMGWVGYRQGKVGMVFEGVYMIGDLLRLEGLEYVGTPVPQIGPKPGTLADSHVLCFRKGIGAAERAAAERFVRYLSDNSIRWAAAGQVPARRSVRDSAAFKAMPLQSEFAKQIPYVMYPPRVGVLFEMSLELDLAVEKVFRGRAKTKEALDVANANFQRFLDRDKRERKISHLDTRFGKPEARSTGITLSPGGRGKGEGDDRGRLGMEENASPWKAWLPNASRADGDVRAPLAFLSNLVTSSIVPLTPAPIPINLSRGMPPHAPCGGFYEAFESQRKSPLEPTNEDRASTRSVWRHRQFLILIAMTPAPLPPGERAILRLPSSPWKSSRLTASVFAGVGRLSTSSVAASGAGEAPASLVRARRPRSVGSLLAPRALRLEPFPGGSA